MRLKVTFVKHNHSADDFRCTLLWGIDHVDIKVLRDQVTVQGIRVALRREWGWQLPRMILAEHKIGTQIEGGHTSQQDNLWDVDFNDVEIDVVDPEPNGP